MRSRSSARDDRLEGLDAAGPAPRRADPLDAGRAARPQLGHGPGRGGRLGRRLQNADGSGSRPASPTPSILPTAASPLARGPLRRGRPPASRTERGRPPAPARARAAACARAARPAPGARRHVARDCLRRGRGVLPRAGGGGDLRGQLARGRRSRRLSRRLGGAPRGRLPRVRRDRAAAADAGRGGARGARPARRPRPDAAEPDRLRAARAGGCVRARPRRRGRERAARRRLPRRDGGRSGRRPRPSPPAGPCICVPSTATGWRSRSSRACSAGSAPVSWRPGRGSCSRIAAPVSSSRVGWCAERVPTTRSSRACCCATDGSSARSA